MSIPIGLCQCGCGRATRVPTQHDPRTGQVRGVPLAFCKGHRRRVDRRLTSDGYVFVRVTEHPRAVKNFVAEHVLVAERALGRHLPAGAVVHHVNTERTDNRPSNLVVLQDGREHAQLHRRLRVLRAGGNPWRDWVCGKCDTPKPFDQFYKLSGRAYSSLCKSCSRSEALKRHHASTPKEAA